MDALLGGWRAEQSPVVDCTKTFKLRLHSLHPHKGCSYAKVVRFASRNRIEESKNRLLVHHFAFSFWHKRPSRRKSKIENSQIQLKRRKKSWKLSQFPRRSEMHFAKTWVSLQHRVILHCRIVRQFNVVNLKRDRFAAKKKRFFRFPSIRYFVETFPPQRKSVHCLSLLHIFSRCFWSGRDRNDFSNARFAKKPFEKILLLKVLRFFTDRIDWKLSYWTRLANAFIQCKI